MVGENYGGVTERYRENQETVECPFCKEAKIDVAYIPAYISWNVSRISAGAKRTRFYHEPKYKVHSKCPKCGKSAREIKQVLESGGITRSHEECLKRLREAGLALRIATKHKKEATV